MTYDVLSGLDTGGVFLTRRLGKKAVLPCASDGGTWCSSVPHRDAERPLG